MRKTIDKFENVLEAATLSTFKVGKILEIRPGGRLVVDYSGNSFGPVEARCVKQDSLSGEYRAGCSVALIFEDQNPLRPIVVGVLSESCLPDSRPIMFNAEGNPPSAVVDGNRIRLRANQEIVLECGESSLLLRKDGKIILKGVEIVSRASRTNKVRGACVKIN